jgi:hypothetical protein
MTNHIEITQVSDKEFWVGENKTILNDNNIIYITVVGEQTDEMALAQKELNHKLFNSVEGQLNFLIDLNRSGKNSSKARSTWNELSANDKIKKAAVFGLNPVSRVIAAFVIGFSVKKNQRFFKTEEEARAWLEE